MCDRNDGNIQHINDTRDADDTFVSHPSDFVIEYQTVDVEVCEQAGNNVTTYGDARSTSKQVKFCQNNLAVSAVPSDTHVVTNDEVLYCNWKKSTNEETTVGNGGVAQGHWAMDNVNVYYNKCDLQPCKIEADGIDESELIVGVSDEVPVVCKSEKSSIVGCEVISKSEDIEIVSKCEIVETNEYLSEYITFHGEQKKVAKCSKTGRLQKRSKRTINKLPRSVKVSVCPSKHKCGAKRLRKSGKNVRRKASRPKRIVNNASLLGGSSLLKNGTTDAADTNDDSTVEEIDKNNSQECSIASYIDTQTVSSYSSSINVPCPITYRYIINHITKDDDSILEWCHQVGLIPAEVQCECGGWKEIQMAKDKPLGLIRKCPLCKIRTSVLKGTWFESSHLSIAQIIELTYMWIYRLPQTYVQHELATSSHHTTGDWYLYCREVCAVILQKTSEKLGGFGKTVEVGETKVGKKKYNMGRVLEGQWILGGIERDSKKMFVVSVKERDVTTFLSVIKEWINPGTTVIAEYVKSYPFQDTELLKEFTATYDIRFIHSSSYPHGQSMNRWKQRDAGDHRKEFQNAYFLEYMYRVKYSNTDDLFLTFVNHLSLVYPGK